MPNYIDPYNKILLYPRYLSSWLQGDVIVPLNIEFDLSNSCLLNCTYCNYTNVHNSSLVSEQDIQQVLEDLAQNNVKSVTYSGGGEPLCNHNAGKAFNIGADLGIEQGLYTNGIFLDKYAISIDKYLSWIHISFHGYNKEDYINKTGKDYFDKVVSNVKYLISMRHKKLVVGMGMVTTSPEGINELYALSKELGVDYCGFKPSCYITDPKILSAMQHVVNSLPEDVVKTPYRYEDQKYQRTYKACHAHSFISCIGADEDLPVWLCCSHRGNRKYCLGSLKTQSFKEIWHSQKRLDIIKSIDFKDCMPACRPHVLNKTLDYILEHNPHAAFQ